MRPDRRDLVDLVEVDDLAVTGSSTQESAGDEGRRSAADRTAGRLVVATVVLALVAAGASIGAVNQSHPVRRLTRVAVLDGGAGGVDAAGCPPLRRCGMRAGASLAGTVRSALPGATVVASTEVFDADSGAIYRRELAARVAMPAGATLRITTQCFPGGVVTSDEPPVSRRRTTDSAGRAVVTVEMTAVTVFSGCSAFVQAQFPVRADALSGSLTVAVLFLAGDPQVLTYR